MANVPECLHQYFYKCFGETSVIHYICRNYYYSHILRLLVTAKKNYSKRKIQIG